MDTAAQQACKTIDVTGLPEEAVRAMQSLVALLRTQPGAGGPTFASREEWARAVRAWAESHQPGATSADWSRESITAVRANECPPGYERPGPHGGAGHAQYQAALDATNALIRRGDQPCIVPQVLYEFWVVATRPKPVNGLGLSVSEAAAELARLKGLFPLFAESAAVFAEWERLVTTCQVSGKNAHDARLAAAMTVNAISHILTINSVHFTRFPGITALEPASIIASP